MSNEISIQLTEDEAWVLFELVRRFSETDKLSIEVQAEERVLWNLCCIFEKTLHQSENISYDEFIKKVYERLSDEE